MRYLCAACLLCLLSETAFPEGETVDPSTISCGPYSLMVVAKMFGINVDSVSISHLAGTTPKGTSMKGLADAAYKLGLQARGMKISLRQLLKLKPPIIAYVNPNHYLVIDKILEDRLHVIENTKPPHFISLPEFKKIWDGYVLVIFPKRSMDRNQPNIQIDNPVYDFGVAESDKVIKHTFLIKNTGNGG